MKNFRNFHIDLKTRDDKKRTVAASISSENPVYMPDLGCEEILEHTPGAVDLSRVPLPVLESHKQDSMPIAVAEKMNIAGGKLRCVLRFGESDRAKELWRDVKSGVLNALSIGYRRFAGDFINDGEQYLTTSWQPYECSLVAIAADSSIGIGRNFKMENQENKRPRQIKREAEQKLREDIAGITTAGERHGFNAEARQAIRDGKTAEQFGAWVLDKLSERNTPTGGGGLDLGLSKREQSNFSLFKCVEALATKNFTDLGVELEASRAIEQRAGRKPTGLFVPFEMIATRASATMPDSAGGYLVGQDAQAPDLFIENLRNSARVIEAGARVLRDLVGDLPIPKRTGSTTGYWVGEGDDVTESNQTFGLVEMGPKTVGGYSDLTRRLRLQSSLDVEALVKSDLMGTLGLSLDLAALNGSGSGAQPLGILNTTGIGSVTLNAVNTPDWGDIVDLKTAIATDNADRGALAFFTNATISGAMEKTEKTANGDGFILENDKLAGKPLFSTNNVPDGHIVYGNWNDLMVGIWGGGGIDINVDTASLSKSGGLRIVALMDCDIAVRHPESFANGYKA